MRKTCSTCTHYKHGMCTDCPVAHVRTTDDNTCKGWMNRNWRTYAKDGHIIPGKEQYVFLTEEESKSAPTYLYLGRF